jgi:hypothetical protein
MYREIIAVSPKNNTKHKQILRENREQLNVNTGGIFTATMRIDR